MRKLMDKQASAAVRSAADSDDETLLMCLQASDMEALGLLFQRYAGLIIRSGPKIARGCVIATGRPQSPCAGVGAPPISALPDS